MGIDLTLMSLSLASETTVKGRAMKSVIRIVISIAIFGVACTVSGCQFWQYNIANGNPAGPPKNRGQDDVISYITTGAIQTGGLHPVAASLNEVCGSSAYRIQAALGPYGYHVITNPLSPAGCGGSGYGDAIVHLGNRVAFPGHPDGILRYTFPTNDQPHHVGAMAVGIGLGGLRILFWTTHLEAGADAAASAQAFQLLQEVHYWQEQTGWPVVVGGDFNLTPNQFPIGTWCRDYYEPSQCNPTSGTASAGKIDYLFSSVPWQDSSLRIGSPNSDHLLLSSSLFTFP